MWLIFFVLLILFIRSAEGYDETDTAFHHKLKASQFIDADNYLDLLSDAHEVWHTNKTSKMMEVNKFCIKYQFILNLLKFILFELNSSWPCFQW